MSRIVTSSEVDRLHAQVKELFERVEKLENPPVAALFDASVFLDTTPAAPGAAPDIDDAIVGKAIAAAEEVGKDKPVDNPPYLHLGVGA
jgi:hypothetical protein